MIHPFRRAALLLLVFLLLSGCASTEREAVRTVEQYLQGLVDQNASLVSNLSCKEWESDALMEVYSFQLVRASLEDLACAAQGKEEEGVTVKCAGAIVTTYNNEMSRIALDQRTYFVRQENGDLFVCGYR